MERKQQQLQLQSRAASGPTAESLEGKEGNSLAWQANKDQRTHKVASLWHGSEQSHLAWRLLYLHNQSIVLRLSECVDTAHWRRIVEPHKPPPQREKTFRLSALRSSLLVVIVLGVFVVQSFTSSMEMKQRKFGLAPRQL